MHISDRTSDRSRAVFIGQGKGITRGAALLPCRRIVALASISLSIFVLMLECYKYRSFGGYLDHIEGNVVIGGWQYIHGVPLYESWDGAPQFAAYYGPLAYLAQVPALLLFGATVAVSKLTSIVALLGTLLMVSIYIVRNPAANEASRGIFLLVAGLLLFGPMTFWVRPDPIETLFVAGAVVSSRYHRRPLWVGICMGLAVSTKIHAFFYFLPILVDIWWTGGRRAILIAAASSAVTFILPFLAPGISLFDYIGQLAQQIGGRAPTSTQLPWTLVAGTLILLPVLVPLALQRQPQRTTVYGLATLATMALLAYPATFPGAGAYHFLPLVPVLADLRQRLKSVGIYAELATFAILVAAWLPVQHTLEVMATPNEFDLAGAEALTLAGNSPIHTVQIGYGDNRQSYQMSQLSKVVLSLNSHAALLDAQVLMELRQIGIDGSARWLPYLRECRIGQWLLPKGERPFAINSYFYDDGAVFSESFRQTFFDHYTLFESTPHFDLWKCTDHRE
jgi:hypothetical protein